MKVTDEELIKKIGRKLKKNNVTEIVRLGGMTNRTYKVKLDGEHYVIRLPGEGTSEMIDRNAEKISTNLACELGIDTNVFLFDEKTGIKISEYIEDAETLNEQELKKEVNIDRVAKILKRLHTCEIDTKIPFDIVYMANKYERLIEVNNGSYFEEYEKVKKFINQIADRYLSSVKRVPCHNDPLCENWILQNNEKMYLIDWEYAGMNDPMWDLADIAIEANFSREQEEQLLQLYLERMPMPSESKAFIINKVLIDYLWSLWGKTRAIYEGESMERYANMRYDRMLTNIKHLIREKLFDDCKAL